MAEAAAAQVSTVVLGYDGGESSQDALSFAKLWAQLTGARLVAGFAYPADLVSREAAERMLRGALGDLPYGQPAAIRAVEARPNRAVLSELAQRYDTLLIVVGAGAGSDELVAGAPCPVAVAPAGFAKRDLKLQLHRKAA